MGARSTRLWTVVAAGAAALVLGGCATTDEHLSAFAWGKPPAPAAETASTATPIPTVPVKDVSGGTIPAAVDPGQVYSNNPNAYSGQAIPLSVDLQCPSSGTALYGATVKFGYHIEYDQRQLFSNSTFDYGDGTHQSATTPDPIREHKYSHGTYKVTLTVTVGSQTASGSCTLNV